MIHIRAVSPVDVTDDLVGSLTDHPGVVNLVVLAGAARNPDGDSLQFDVINLEANHILHLLRTYGLDRRGSIVIENVDSSISDFATRAEGREPATANFAPIWEAAEARRTSSTPRTGSPSWSPFWPDSSA